MTREKMMKKVYLAVLLSLFLITPARAADDISVYDVINQEDTTTFSYLMMLGYDINDGDQDGNTALMIASALGKARFVNFLLDNGADVDLLNNEGLTAMHRAAQAGNNEIIDILFTAGANIDMPDFAGYTPLMQAVEAERRFTVERLVTLGAYLGWRAKNGESALSLAEHRKYKTIAAYLRNKGAKY